MNLQQLDAIDGSELCESLIKIEDETIPDSQLDELLLLYWVDLLLDLALTQDYHQGVWLQHLTQVTSDQRPRLVLDVFQRRHLLEGIDVERI